MGQNTIDFVSNRWGKSLSFMFQNGAKPPNTVVNMGQKNVFTIS